MSQPQNFLLQLFYVYLLIAKNILFDSLTPFIFILLKQITKPFFDTFLIFFNSTRPKQNFNVNKQLLNFDL